MLQTRHACFRAGGRISNSSTSQSPADRVYSVAELSVVRLIHFLRVDRRPVTSSHVAVAVAKSSALTMRCSHYDSSGHAEVAVQVASQNKFASKSKPCRDIRLEIRVDAK